MTARRRREEGPLIRVAYACRDLGRDTASGPGGQVFATAQAMARAGHEVYLVSEAITAARSRELLSAGSPTWVRVEESRPRHRYFTESQGYADRVYDTLRRLQATHPLDVAEFTDTGGEALTTLRAQRLLGDFPGMLVAVLLVPPGGAARPGASVPRAAALPAMATAFAERYCREHAGLLVATSAPAARAGGSRRVLLRPDLPVPAPVLPGRPGPGNSPDAGDRPAAADPPAPAAAGPPVSAEPAARWPAVPGFTAAVAAGYRTGAGRAPARRSGGSGSAGMPLVSVLIPLFNQGRYLADALASVRGCDYPRLEVVVVDDGSTDPATVAAFDALSGVRKVRQANAGLAAARNAGLARCRGRYVVPLDADDEVPPAFVGAAVGALRRDPRLRCVTGYVRYYDQLDLVQVPLGPVPGLSVVVNTHARATGLFCRRTLVELGGWDTGLPAYEDWDLYLRMHAAGHRTDVLPIEGHRYRRHRASMTFGATPEQRLELLQRLLDKHAGELPRPQLLALLHAVTQFWKTGYEPSASARLLAGRAGGRTEAARDQAGEA